ncbi:PLP-dependent cysteine synthase family protein [Thermofilum pendens]|uniref:Pyridoxal-5'-phosphate-dependent enzyme, beta subunit n=1 Tax=Thermofilum pendens (strain DSM 2475 / Hrk 5) TaxID=368408 RepID=A1S0M0_THEPD|nr:PLP-dependent cysteine synthase family protein [Thermofilum pendens]ABL79000.1 Pyridoxal-5'-phosphate-dependent enzyme, beta subunit [Thermofilum pendens Hrk 5]
MDARFRGDEHLRRVLEVASRILREGRVKCLSGRPEDALVEEALAMLGCRVPRCGEAPAECSLEELGFYEDVSPSTLRVFNSTEELLYKNWPTPLVRLNSLGDGKVRAWAKLEFFNPFSMSVKDRIGWYMVKKLLEKHPGASLALYEATSTNTGMALAAMGAIKGFRVKLFLPETIQKASDTLLSVMGAEVRRVPKSLTVEFIDDVEHLAKEEGGVHLNQFENDANFGVHLRYTAKELDLQVRSAKLNLRGIVGGLGTSGHLSALSLYFKSRYSDVKIYGVQPAPGTVIPGIRRVETGMKWVHYVSVDKVVDVTPEEAVAHAVKVARREGILVGLSSGAVTAAFEALYSGGELPEGDYVLVYPDHGFKYVEQFSKYLPIIHQR